MPTAYDVALLLVMMVDVEVFVVVSLLLLFFDTINGECSLTKG
jgi:hypothetical protein